MQLASIHFQLLVRNKARLNTRLIGKANQVLAPHLLLIGLMLFTGESEMIC